MLNICMEVTIFVLKHMDYLCYLWTYKICLKQDLLILAIAECYNITM